MFERARDGCESGANRAPALPPLILSALICRYLPAAVKRRAGPWIFATISLWICFTSYAVKADWETRGYIASTKMWQRKVKNANQVVCRSM
jgi:hypothetical protein